MIKLALSVTVNRPVAEVWTFISTFEHTTRWSRGVLEATQTSTGPLGVGSTLQTVVQAFGRRRTGTYLVTEYEPNTAFAFTVTSGPMTSRARFSVEPVEEGTRLTASGEAEATGLYKLLAPILVRTLKRHSQDDLTNIKRILEASIPANQRHRGVQRDNEHRDRHVDEDDMAAQSAQDVVDAAMVGPALAAGAETPTFGGSNPTKVAWPQERRSLRRSQTQPCALPPSGGPAVQWPHASESTQGRDMR
jgi:carbon monoxide dehydrogenase subunit G